MATRPPDVLVTTPESLYLLLTSDKGRQMLRTAEAVIVDEIHSLAGDKRGAHLSLSLERLAALSAQPVQRIGVSATQKPLSRVARFLGGWAPAGAGSMDAGLSSDGGERIRGARKNPDASPQADAGGGAGADVGLGTGGHAAAGAPADPDAGALAAANEAKSGLGSRPVEDMAGASGASRCEALNTGTGELAEVGSDFGAGPGSEAGSGLGVDRIGDTLEAHPLGYRPRAVVIVESAMVEVDPGPRDDAGPEPARAHARRRLAADRRTAHGAHGRARAPCCSS